MLQDLQNFAKFRKIQLDNLVDFENCCKTRIHLQRSAPIQPKTSEISPKFAKNLQLPHGSTSLRAPAARGPAGGSPRGARGGPARDDDAERGGSPRGSICKFLVGSFSAVSKPNFARKYAFDSIFQALQDLHTSALLHTQHLSKFQC